jgi:ribosomal protein S18 acetylase RimI-like enzyme
MQIVPAHAVEYLPAIRQLFTEYAETLDRRICFKDFEHELAGLPGRYAPPEGGLWLAFDNGNPVGCVGLRKLADGIGEMKRLYVRPDFRGFGAGRALAEAAIRQAQLSDYERMRLDTLPPMHAAIALYESLGFCRLPASSDGCCATAIDMELPLHLA